MAVPKRKLSKSRQGMRRSHHHAHTRDICVCTNCQSSKLPHRICPHCGYYKNKEVIAMEEE